MGFPITLWNRSCHTDLHGCFVLLPQALVNFSLLCHILSSQLHIKFSIQILSLSDSVMSDLRNYVCAASEHILSLHLNILVSLPYYVVLFNPVCYIFTEVSSNAFRNCITKLKIGSFCLTGGGAVATVLCTDFILSNCTSKFVSTTVYTLSVGIVLRLCFHQYQYRNKFYVHPQIRSWRVVW